MESLQVSFEWPEWVDNFTEASSRKLQAELDMDHLSIWTENNRQFLQEKSSTIEEKKYIFVDERIKKIVSNFDNGTICEYLRGIVHKFLMDWL